MCGDGRRDKTYGTCGLLADNSILKILTIYVPGVIWRPDQASVKTGLTVRQPGSIPSPRKRRFLF